MIDIFGISSQLGMDSIGSVLTCEYAVSLKSCFLAVDFRDVETIG